MAIILNDNIQVNVGKPLENKYLNPINNIPYTGITHVNTTIIESLRHIGLTVNIANKEYWYATGTTDSDLILKSSTPSGNTFNNGLINQGGVVSLGGTLTRDTAINTNNFGIAFGSGSVAIGDNSFAEGNVSRACGNNSHAEGFNTTTTGLASHAEGQSTTASGNFSHSEGNLTTASGTYGSHAEGNRTTASGCASHSEGFCTIASGTQSHAQGYRTTASGCVSHAGGLGTSTRNIIASGCASFNHSLNNFGQTSGHGALAPQSVILGGFNNNIEIGNSNAAIIGGVAIKLTGNLYVNTTAVGILAIMSTPTTGVSSDTVLVRDSSTGIIRQVAQSSLGGGGLPVATFNTYTGATSTILSGLRSDVDTVSGATASKLNTSVFNTYTGATDTTLSGLRTDVDDNRTIIDTLTGDTLTVIKSITASTYTVIDSDNRKILVFTNSCTVTLLNSLPIGTELAIQNVGSGNTITVTAQGTLQGDTTITGQYIHGSFYKQTATIWTSIIGGATGGGSNYTNAEARAAVAKFPTQIFRFTDIASTFEYTQAEDFKINTIVAQTGVTVTIKLSDGTTNYVLGATVNAFDYLIFSVDVVGSFKINAEIL